MIDQNKIWAETEHGFDAHKLPLTILNHPFTRSNGTVISRIYERLTKASRRREPDAKRLINIPGGIVDRERAYRQGVYDAFKALQEELTE